MALSEKFRLVVRETSIVLPALIEVSKFPESITSNENVSTKCKGLVPRICLDDARLVQAIVIIYDIERSGLFTCSREQKR